MAFPLPMGVGPYGPFRWPGVSWSVLTDEQVCRTNLCRNQVAQANSGDMEFVFDRHGVKWKCVNRRQLSDNPGEGWGCAEMQCQEANRSVMRHGFRFQSNCDKVVATVDALKVEEAPSDWHDYMPLEQLGTPPPPECAAMPPLILALPLPGELLRLSQASPQPVGSGVTAASLFAAQGSSTSCAGASSTGGAGSGSSTGGSGRSASAMGARASGSSLGRQPRAAPGAPSPGAFRCPRAGSFL